MHTANMIFVFGSNEGGHHGRGAALTASRFHGAQYGRGYGHVGKSFGIPTKDRTIRHTISLGMIEIYVRGFLAYASGRPDLNFQITCIGCGLAGLTHEQVAPMFADHSSNCFFDTLWEPWLPAGTNFWGTF